MKLKAQINEEIQKARANCIVCASNKDEATYKFYRGIIAGLAWVLEQQDNDSSICENIDDLKLYYRQKK